MGNNNLNKGNKQEFVYTFTNSEILDDKLTNTEDSSSNGCNIFLYFAAITVNFLVLSCGLPVTWSSSMIPRLRGLEGAENNPLPRPVTEFEESWIIVLVTFAASFGPLVFGKMADKFGRKRTLLVIGIPVLLGHIITIWANRVYHFYIARFLCGVSFGGAYTVVPIYSAEISEVHNRGRIGSFIGIFLNCGMVLSYLLGPLVSIRVFSIISAIPAVIFMTLFSVHVPESPYYLVLKDDVQAAKYSLRRLHSGSVHAIEKELCEIKKSVQESLESKGGLTDLLRHPSLRKRLFITMFLMFLQQCSGISFVLTYLQPIFRNTGSSVSPYFSTNIIGCVKLASLSFTSYIIEKFKRRTLLIGSGVGCSVTLGILGVYFYLKLNNYDISGLFWLPVANLFIYINCYNSGLSPIPWIFMGEVFPANVKSAASTVTSVFAFGSASVIVFIFPVLSKLFGIDLFFFVFSFCCLGGVTIAYFFVPETKGKSLYEIQKMLKST